MARKLKDEIAKYESEVKAGRLVEIRLFVPKDVADMFRRVAKKSKMTTQALLTEMVDIYADGLRLNRPK